MLSSVILEKKKLTATIYTHEKKWQIIIDVINLNTIESKNIKN